MAGCGDHRTGENEQGGGQPRQLGMKVAVERTGGDRREDGERLRQHAYTRSLARSTRQRRWLSVKVRPPKRHAGEKSGTGQVRQRKGHRPRRVLERKVFRPILRPGVPASPSSGGGVTRARDSIDWARLRSPGTQRMWVTARGYALLPKQSKGWEVGRLWAS